MGWGGNLLGRRGRAREASCGSVVRGFLPSPCGLSLSSRCWFQKEPALYATVHVYFLVSFLFGAVVLALVAWKIVTLPSATAGKERGQTWKSVFTVLGLSSLVGMTWGLAVLTPLGLSTIYIFALFNSLQGEAPGRATGCLISTRGTWGSVRALFRTQDSTEASSSQRY